MHTFDLDQHFPPEMERREFEVLTADVLNHYADLLAKEPDLERTRDTIQLTLNFTDRDECVVLLTPDAVDIRWPYTDWVSSHFPAVSSTSWRRVKLNGLSVRKLCALIEESRTAYRETITPCHHCGERLPPENLITVGEHHCCHGCAPEHHGITF